MAMSLKPATLNQRQLLMGYLNDALDAETAAWFEAWLLTQEPLIELLDRFNDARDALSCIKEQDSRAHHPMTVGGGVRCWRQTAAAGQFRRQHFSAAALLLPTDHRSETSHHRSGSRCAVEEMSRPDRQPWIDFAPGTYHVGTGRHAKYLGAAVTPERVAAHPAGQIQRADGQHPGTRRRILDAVSVWITIAGCRDNQHPVPPRQPRERARQHARRRVSGAIESQAQGNDIGALSQSPGTGQFDRETVTATIVFNDLGDQQARIGGHAVATTTIKGLTGAGDNAGAGCAVTVRAAILDGTGSHQRNAPGDSIAAEIGVFEVHSAIENGDAHAGPCSSVGIQSQRLRRQHAWTWIRGDALLALSDVADAFGTIHPQSPTPDLAQQLPAADLANEHRAQRRHKQRGAIAAPEPEADQVLDQLSPTGQQFRRLSRRKA
jgi:hypothetical protein